MASFDDWTGGFLLRVYSQNQEVCKLASVIEAVKVVKYSKLIACTVSILICPGNFSWWCTFLSLIIIQPKPSFGLWLENAKHGRHEVYIIRSSGRWCSNIEVGLGQEFPWKWPSAGYLADNYNAILLFSRKKANGVLLFYKWNLVPTIEVSVLPDAFFDYGPTLLFSYSTAAHAGTTNSRGPVNCTLCPKKT